MWQQINLVHFAVKNGCLGYKIRNLCCHCLKLDLLINLKFCDLQLQGTAITVAMDQLRQSLQLCGKLLFALMSEVMDVSINNGLTPNLCGGDPRVDMGFKGTETAMASYMSELDYLTNPLTNHVLSAEIRNQSVNSLALISARKTEQALEILQMMVTNIINALIQAIDLRWMKTKVENEIRRILNDCNIEECDIILKLFPWYEFLYLPMETLEKLVTDLPRIRVENGLDLEVLKKLFCSLMEQMYSSLKNGEYTDEVESSLGEGINFVKFYPLPNPVFLPCLAGDIILSNFSFKVQLTSFPGRKMVI